jgi:dihydrofolate reductase
LAVASAVRSLLGEGLFDELKLMVHPVVLDGKRLFEGGDDRRDLKFDGLEGVRLFS